MGNCWIKFFGEATHHDDDDDDNDDEVESQLAGGNVHLITTMEKWEEKLSHADREGKIVVANFSAPWCSPCRSIKETYVETADKYPHILFLTVDVDNLDELSTSLGVRATPTFFFLKGGRTIDKLIGANKEMFLTKTAALTDLAT